MILLAERYARRSNRRAARTSALSGRTPLAVAPSGRMSCSQRTQGTRLARANAMAGPTAGNEGETAMTTSGRARKGALKRAGPRS